MAGFLDKNDRIVDMVLTGEGKYQLSVGKLEFVYWRAFDDEVDYDPFISQSGSLTEDELVFAVQAQIESTPVREAVSGYRRQNLICRDDVNVRDPVFTMPHGQTVLPRSFAGEDLEDVSIEVKQRKRTEVLEQRDHDGNLVLQVGPYDRGYERFEPADAKFSLRNDGFSSDHRDDGFLIRMLVSGTHGYSELDPKHSGDNSLCFGADLQLIPRGGPV